MAGHFLLLPHAVPPGDVTGVPARELEALRRELDGAGRLSVYDVRGLRLAEERRQAGGRVLWAFPNLADALVCAAGRAWGGSGAQGPTDPRFLLEGAPALDIVRVEGERLLADTRFIRPGPATVAAEMPRLLPERQRAWLRHAAYYEEQWLLALTVEELARAPRLPPRRALEAVLDVALRRTRARTQRERLKRLPRDPGAWAVEALQHFTPLREYGDGVFDAGPLDTEAAR